MEDFVLPRLYNCYKCQNPVSRHDDIVSKDFQDRQLMTGLHTVADVYCKDCGEVLGWKYEKAYEQSQKYKEGKFILEKFKIVKNN
uniref:Protein yippee-like n=1 Tax=Cannabis sativa TaxID=3483 RepID=A0A803NUV2_CANSA